MFVALACGHAGPALAQFCTQSHIKEVAAYYGTASGAGITRDGLALSEAKIPKVLADQIILDPNSDARVKEHINDFVDPTLNEQAWVEAPPDNLPAQQHLEDDLSAVPPPLTVSFSAPVLVRTYDYLIAIWTTVGDPGCPITDHEGIARVTYYELNGTIEAEGQVAAHCATLGDDPKPSLLDQDIFRMRGTKGERVTITLDDVGANNQGERATLLLAATIPKVLFVRLDSSALPNAIQATLPATGNYLLTVAEHPRSKHSASFRGQYCVTLESSGAA